MICISSICRFHHFFIGSIQSAVADVLHDAALKQPGILQYHAKIIPQLLPVEISYIVAVKRNAAALYVIKTHQQFYNGGFARASRPYNSDFLSRLYISAEIFDDDLFRIIAEPNVIEFDSALWIFQLHRIGYGLILLLFVEELEHTLRGRSHRLHLIDDLCNLLNRLCKVLYILDERLDISDTDGSLDGEDSAGDCNSCISQIADKHHNRLHHAGQEL